MLAPRDRPRATADQILNRIKAILAAYRRDDLADADGWTQQVATLLERFPREVIDYVSDPITGVQSYVRWGVPNLADIRAACDDRMAKLAAEYAWKRPQVLAAPMDRTSRPTLQELKAQFGPDWGIGRIDNLKEPNPQ